MAIFTKINQKRGIIVTFISLALLLFVVVSGPEIVGLTSWFSDANSVGKINGKSIKYEDFERMKENKAVEMEIRYNQKMEDDYVQQQLWKDLIFRYAFQPEFDKLGLVVTEEEQNNLKEGKFMSAEIKAFFSPNGQFDPMLMQQFFTNFDQYPANIQNAWTLLEMKLPESRIREKYVNLLKKTEYVTKAEAKFQYVAQTEKAEVKYFFVPYYAIQDTAVKVTDDMMREYLSQNIKKYQVEDGRSMDYVIFDVKPSAADSAKIQAQVAEIVQDFKTTKTDTAFTQEKSDNYTAPAYTAINTLPQPLQELSLQKDSVYGPFAEGTSYKIYKVIGEKTDTTLFVRASHILFMADENASAEDKAKAKKQAQEILAKIKAGANFADMARQYGTDGTKDRGGDLGWFGKGQMVPQFQDACFSAKKEGLLPNLVETRFGYHIIEITEAPTGKQYLLASVNKDIYPSDETKDQTYAKAEKFKEQCKDSAAFYATIKKDSLNKLTHKNAGKLDQMINGVPNSREIVRWSYDKAELGDVSPVFTVDNGNKYVIVVLTDVRNEGPAELKDVQDEIRVKVINQEKAKMIKAKLEPLKGKKTFEEMAQAYGVEARSGSEPNLTLHSSYLQQVGYDPAVVGKAIAMKPGSRTDVLEGENGIVIIEVVNVTKAPEIADHSTYKTQLQQQREGRDDQLVEDALNKMADVKDNRYKFY